MRRIYESSALRRDDSDPFSPTERSTTDRPRAMRSVPAGWLSRKLVPDWLRHRSVEVSIETQHTEYPYKSPIPFRVEFRNRMPFPITITTRSAILWLWEVDGLPEASHVSLDSPPAESEGLKLDRGARVRIVREWDGMFRVSPTEWERAAPGEYTLSARLNVDDAERKGLYDETVVRILEP